MLTAQEAAQLSLEAQKKVAPKELGAILRQIAVAASKGRRSIILDRMLTEDEHDLLQDLRYFVSPAGGSWQQPRIAW